MWDEWEYLLWEEWGDEDYFDDWTYDLFLDEIDEIGDDVPF